MMQGHTETKEATQQLDSVRRLYLAAVVLYIRQTTNDHSGRDSDRRKTQPVLEVVIYPGFILILSGRCKRCLSTAYVLTV